MAIILASVELRGQAPRLTADVLDAISARRGMTRWDLVLEVLNRYTDERLQEAIAITRVARSNEEGGK